MRLKVLKRNQFLLSVFILFLGCAQVTSLNLERHEFGRIPTKIVWIQVDGLAAEHMALLKFSYPSRDIKTAFEKSICTGSTWNYDLYNMRPSAYGSFLAQMSGKKNIKGNCEDYAHKPIWKYIATQGYKIGIFEGEARDKDSLTQSLSCKKNKDYLEETVLWRMKTMKTMSGKEKFFHATDKTSFKRGSVYYDKSCSAGECFTVLSRNVEGTFQNFSKNTKNYLYIVRNFNYARLLRKGKIKEARSELNEINSILGFFQKKAKKSNDILVLLTSAKSLDLNFPKSGKGWRAYEKNIRPLRVNHTKLISSIYATGARSENFCGVFDQSQILSRIFSGAKQQGLEFSIINPFY